MHEEPKEGSESILRCDISQLLLLDFAKLASVQCRGLYIFYMFQNAAVLTERILSVSATLTWRK